LWNQFKAFKNGEQRLVVAMNRSEVPNY
jgi:hypothetical protein